MRGFKIGIFVLAIVAMAIQAPYLLAGVLDTTFGNSGKVITPIGDASAARAVMDEGDLKVLVAGDTTIAGLKYFAIARYNYDGSLDPTFGSGGTTFVDFINDSEGAYAIAEDTTGRIITAGYRSGTNNTWFAVARNMRDGSPDSSFSGNGRTSTLIGTSSTAFAVAVQSDGKIVLAGDADVGATQQFAVARYLVDGSLDMTFGMGGLMTTDVSPGLDSARAILLDYGTGAILVAGVANNDFAVVRYNSDGTLDSTFGLNGIVTIDLGNNDFAAAIQWDIYGRIVLAGYTYDNTFHFKPALVRLNNDGSLDTTFGSGGRVVTDLPAATRINGLTLADGRRPVVAGSSEGQLAIVGYTEQGQLDPNFGTNGVEVTAFPGTSILVSGVASEEMEKIYVVGAAYDNSTSSFAIARYFPRDFLFYDNFSDSVQSWNILSGNWIEDSWALKNTDPKGEIVTPVPWFPSGQTGCTTCTFSTYLYIEDPGSTVILEPWYQDKANKVELLLKQAKGKWKLKQIQNGVVTAKGSRKSPVQTHFYYRIEIQYLSGAFHVYVDGTEVLTIPTSVTPAGIFGVKAKKTRINLYTTYAY